MVGKGPDSEPPIDIDTMIELTAKAEVDGVKFDGFDLFLFDPHMNIDASGDEIKIMAEKASSHNLEIGSFGCPGLDTHRWWVGHGYFRRKKTVCDPGT